MGEQSIPQIKQQLQQELGPENFASYLKLLREWFGQRMTKHTFDYEVSTLFGEKGFLLHNQLLHAVLLQSVGGFTGISANGSQIPVLGVQTNNLPTIANGVPNVNISSFADKDQEKNNENNYIIPPVPGEEPFIYPPHARDYPTQVQDTQQSFLDCMEQEPPPDCEWLAKFKVTFPATEENVPDRSTKNRFPPWFAHDFQPVTTKSYAREVNVVPNVTDVYHMLGGILERKPHLKQHFVIPRDKDKSKYLSSGCSLYGRALIKAWAYNIQNVNQLVIEHAVKATKENMKSIIMALITQRRPFRMRDKHIIHSVGVPTPNPYLRQSYHLYEEPYGSDTTKMADVVMQVPAPLATLEEKERLAALQVASTYPPKDSRFNSAKGTMLDLLCAIKKNPSLIRNHSSRFRLIDSIQRSCKGYNGTYNVQYSHDDEDDDIAVHTAQALPLASY